MKRLILLALLAFAACGGEDAQRAPQATTEPSGVVLDEIGSFDSPVFVTSPPDDDRVFVVEKGGTIRIVGRRRQPFLDISDKVSTSSEQGLLGLAFPPDYASSGLFYVYYTDSDGTNTRSPSSRARTTTPPTRDTPALPDHPGRRRAQPQRRA